MSGPRASTPNTRTPSSSNTPQARKASQPAGGAKAAPRFYDGPTVSAKAEEIKDKAKTVAKVTAAEAQRQSRNAAKTVRRHPWGLASLFTTIPFLVFISLFSTVVCPPPHGSPSNVSRYILSPLGLHHPNTDHSPLLQTLCHPSNIYHREVLQPYVYPVIDHAQTRLLQHPVYKNGLEPGYALAKDTSQRLWDGPLQPVVDRITRGARRFYLTFVQPHIPYLKARAQALTAPYSSRASAFHQSYISPRLATAQSYAKNASDRTAKTYTYVSTHPLTGTTQKFLNAFYQVARRRGYDAYVWSRPHLIRAGQLAETIAKEFLGPHAVRALQWGADQAVRGWVVLKLQVTRMYNIHLDPYVGPQISKASVALSPYASTFTAKVYNPYLRPAMEAFLPAIVFAPEPPQTFWSMIADKLPIAGSNFAQNKGSLGDFYSDVHNAKRPADVPVPSAEKRVNSRGMDRAEMDRVREAIKERVEKQGQKGYEKVHDELLKLHKDIISSDKIFPSLATSARDEMNRDIDYILGGLDKLYTTSTSLTRDQVKQSSEMADDRLAKKVVQIKERIEKKRVEWFDDGQPIVKEGSEAVDAALGREYKDLQSNMAGIDDITQRDRQKLLTLKKGKSSFCALLALLTDTAADDWKGKYTALHKGETKDRQLNDASANIPKAINALTQELDDVSEGFRGRIGILTRTAYDRIDARKAMPSSSRSSSHSSSSPPSGSATILPIAEMGAAAAAAGAVIGKGKDQVMDALSQASSVARGETATPGVVDQAKSVASSAYDAASSGVHDATRSAMSAVGATPSPESPMEYAESVLDAASKQASSANDAAGAAVHVATLSAKSAVGATPTGQSLGDHAESLASVASMSAVSLATAAGDAVHQGTRWAISAVGATPSPETLGEHVESFVDAASKSAASLASAGSDVVRQGTRSAMSAVGATPSPESLGEHAASLVDAASKSAASLASAAGDAIQQGTRSAMSVVGATPTPESVQEHLESIASGVAQGYASVAGAVNDNMHDLTRSAMKAVGATPSPESLGEHAESIASVASSSASSLASVVSSAVHDGTRSARSAVGVSPTPESPAEHIQSIASAASASASSVASAASSALHDGTRSAMRAVGATPSPETPMEHVESVYNAVSSSAGSVYDAASSTGSSVYDAATSSASSAFDAASSAGGTAGALVTDQAVLLASQIQAALGLVPTPSPIASTASAYLSSLASAGSSAGSELLASGSSLLVSLQSEASTTIHSATRAASQAVGATPTPEKPGEYVQFAQERMRDGTRSLESFASSVSSGAAEATESVKKMVGRDEL